MATIAKLLGTELVRITVPLGTSEGQPIREIFGRPRVITWINDTLPKLPKEHDRCANTPEEEFDDLLFNYISSMGKMRYDKTFKDLIPASDEVWELKTYQLRIFGWFYRKDQFIAVVPARAPDVKYRSEGYRQAKDEVIAARNRLPLDEPRFVGGVITNVLSGV